VPAAQPTSRLAWKVWAESMISKVIRRPWKSEQTPYHLGDKAASFPRRAGTAWAPRQCLWNYGWKLSRYHNHAKRGQLFFSEKCEVTSANVECGVGDWERMYKVKAALRSWQLGNSNTVQTHSVKKIPFKHHPKFDNTWHVKRKILTGL
jgi:hypothetical protein